ncbi:hypothetical protein A2686_01495 [Candidatus Woesebacteria bacterium RIFCSPHIGHO2_01_FULL_38_10]|uniref:Uncharacterized protein n=1 Tax=Candidatus Woesebacteria bacterium RIFCSPLOWO2_01_FULL_39_10b TaxID=1802517 RepID=A0A1F8B7I8_9BACT|nr:MAG: hypothetical protein A2686_01495 [Candidatus Woesebacteria bacterium RIFCSPHIGHO2_01_FULL_38_10]OGM59971.1 MAG: hypothetical protein A2892_03675 [Candidatus Woesebacteria bacterium RIFCSPLOWO2_01_FULL_39_10b]
MTERFIKDGKLTEEGRQLAGEMNNAQCDRRPCYFCGGRDSETKDPGGNSCPAAGKLNTAKQVDEIMTIYLGRAPKMEAVSALLSRRRP